MPDIPIYETSGPAARELSDLTSILNDLQRTITALKRLLSDSDDAVVSDALFTSSLVTYRRCFASGVRSGLNRSHILAIGHNAEELHEHLIAQANKLAAHSVNAFEETKVGVLVEDDKVVGSAVFSKRLLTFKPEGIHQWSRLIDSLIRHLKPIIAVKQDAVVKEVQTRSISDVRRGGILQHDIPVSEQASNRR